VDDSSGGAFRRSAVWAATTFLSALIDRGLVYSDVNGNVSEPLVLNKVPAKNSPLIVGEHGLQGFGPNTGLRAELAGHSSGARSARGALHTMAGQFAVGGAQYRTDQVLNWQDLAQLLGSMVRFPHPQRQELERLTRPASFQGLACFNARCLGADEQSDLYFDPHTKQYTGQENVLQGWCPAIRSADKAMHSDFSHTAAVRAALL
jgi:hypothetical protein